MKLNHLLSTSRLPGTCVRFSAGLGRSLRLTHADQNLSPSQRDVLGTVVRRGPVGLSELASIEGLNPTMLSRIAAKLEGAGLIVRAPDRKDGRAASLAATDAGTEDAPTDQNGAY